MVPAMMWPLLTGGPKYECDYIETFNRSFVRSSIQAELYSKYPTDHHTDASFCQEMLRIMNYLLGIVVLHNSYMVNYYSTAN